MTFQKPRRARAAVGLQRFVAFIVFASIPGCVVPLYGPVGPIDPVVGSYRAGQFDIFEIAGAPKSITIAPGGELWYTYGDVSSGMSRVGRISTLKKIEFRDTILVREFPVHQNNVFPRYITATGNGTKWVSAQSAELLEPGSRDEIIRISGDGVVKRFPLPAPHMAFEVQQLAAGFDGTVWFAESKTDAIGGLEASGEFKEYLLPSVRSRKPRDRGPVGVAIGHDGCVWFTVLTPNKIGRLCAGRKMRLFPIPTAHSAPTSIVPSRNALWFTESNAGKIARIDSKGRITEVLVPVRHPQYIAAGQDGELWFADEEAPDIYRLRRGHELTRFSTPNQAPVTTLTVSPGGDVWFTQEFVTHVRSPRFFDAEIGAVGRLRISQ